MASNNSSPFAPQFNASLFNEPTSLASLSAARATNPFAWLTYDVARNEYNNQLGDALSSQRETNALRAALFNRQLQAGLAEKAMETGSKYVPFVANKGGFIGNIFPGSEPVLSNPMQMSMDVNQAIEPGLKNFATLGAGAKDLGSSGYIMTPGSLAKLLSPGVPPSAGDFVFDPASTQSGYNARQSGNDFVHKVTKISPDGTQQITDTYKGQPAKEQAMKSNNDLIYGKLIARTKDNRNPEYFGATIRRIELGDGVERFVVIKDGKVKEFRDYKDNMPVSQDKKVNN